MSEAIILRGLERLFIVGTAALFGYLGYKLFIHGVNDEKAKMTFKSSVAQVTFSGAAPGLLFMAFGAFVLMYALVFGGASSTEKLTSSSAQESKNIPASPPGPDISKAAQDAEIDSLRKELAAIKPAQAAEIQLLRKDCATAVQVIRGQTLKMEAPPVEKAPVASAKEVADLRKEVEMLKAGALKQQ